MFHVVVVVAVFVAAAAAAAEWEVCMWKYWLLDHSINWRIDAMRRICEWEGWHSVQSQCFEIGKLPFFYMRTQHNAMQYTMHVWYDACARICAICWLCSILLTIAFHLKIFSHSVSMLIGLRCIFYARNLLVSKCLKQQQSNSFVVCLLFLSAVRSRLHRISMVLGEILWFSIECIELLSSLHWIYDFYFFFNFFLHTKDDLLLIFVFFLY